MLFFGYRKNHLLILGGFPKSGFMIIPGQEYPSGHGSTGWLVNIVSADAGVVVTGTHHKSHLVFNRKSESKGCACSKASFTRPSSHSNLHRHKVHGCTRAARCQAQSDWADRVFFRICWLGCSSKTIDDQSPSQSCKDTGDMNRFFSDQSKKNPSRKKMTRVYRENQ